MNLILTIAVGKDYEEMSAITHPSIKAYADKIGAEFMCIKEKKLANTTPHWDKFQIYDLLDKYDRILYLDTDLIIREDCPDLFLEVPNNKLGMFEEGQFTERSKELMIDICRQYEERLPSWNGKYYNSGVIVISQIHKPLFKKPEKEIFSFYEQSYLNMRIAKLGVDIHSLHYKFNRMTCMDAYTGEERYASYIIHYAGYPSLVMVKDLIKMDMDKWRRDKGEYNYRRHIYINVSGGLGDQICAEPAIRYMRKNLYPNDEMVVATHWPRIFEHFKKLGIEVCEQGKANLRQDTPYFLCSSLPGPETLNWMIVSHLLCHTVDYASIALMKRTLPVLDKQIQFEVRLQDYSDLFDLVDQDYVKNSVVVHPGKHWESKTFPVKYWQDIINGIAEKRNVIIVGKSEPGDPPDYIAGARGTVDVVCPENGVDLREKLNLGGFGALLSIAPCLISNDSAPIHLAGAFQNKIILIPSCKHPDHILPYRNGSVLSNAVALYKELIINTVESRPTQVYPTSVDIGEVEWEKYLPDVSDVLEKV